MVRLRPWSVVGTGLTGAYVRIYAGAIHPGRRNAAYRLYGDCRVQATRA